MEAAFSRRESEDKSQTAVLGLSMEQPTLKPCHMHPANGGTSVGFTIFHVVINNCSTEIVQLHVVMLSQEGALACNQLASVRHLCCTCTTWV